MTILRSFFDRKYGINFSTLSPWSGPSFLKWWRRKALTKIRLYAHVSEISIPANVVRVAQESQLVEFKITWCAIVMIGCHISNQPCNLVLKVRVLWSANCVTCPLIWENVAVKISSSLVDKLNKVAPWIQMTDVWVLDDELYVHAVR